MYDVKAATHSRNIISRAFGFTAAFLEGSASLYTYMAKVFTDSELELEADAMSLGFRRINVDPER